jgi:hypothetical protein
LNPSRVIYPGEYSHVRLDAKRNALEQLDVKHEQQALEPKVAVPIQEVFV